MKNNKIADLPKLVRDDIPRLIAESGKKYKSHIADSIEFPKRLKEKMMEEVQELYHNPSLSEAADVYEVFLSMMKIFKFDLDDVVMVANHKRDIAGSFTRAIILDNVIDIGEQKNG